MILKPGLQPERTYLSWLRTILVLFVINITALKLVASKLESVFLFLALIAIHAVIVCLVYSNARFSKFGDEINAITVKEVRAKQFLSIYLVAMVILYMVHLYINLPVSRTL